MNLSPKAFALIIDHEGMNQPGKWPGGSSGITIGYGYDLGYHTIMELHRDWGDKLPNSVLNRLAQVTGKRGDAARVASLGLRDIAIPKDAAMQVFRDNSVPQYIAKARRAFPGMEQLPDDAAGALVSLVYNRGPSIDENDPRRAEMDTIHDILADGVQRGDLAAIACQIRSMKRLWVGKGLDGLLRRREDEARLVESCIT